MTASVFADFKTKLYKSRYEADLLVYELHGGTPVDQNKAKGWVESKVEATDEVIQKMIVDALTTRGIDPASMSPADMEAAIADTVELKQLNAFKRLPTGELCIEGRQVKAMLKEAASIAVAGGHLNARGWGKTNKGLLGFLAEHLFVAEDKIGIGVTEPSGISQRFVHTWRGNGIQYEEFVLDAKVSFTVLTDFDWPKDFWPTVWTVAEENGLGASRSMGFGRFAVTGWSAL